MSLEDLLKRVDEAGFTPGPWWACIGSDQPVPYYRGLVMYVSHDPRITICTGAEGDKSGRTCDSSEWEANARLIAASPDMFEALLAARETLLNIGRPETNDRHHEVYQKIESALLRALISQNAAPKADVGGEA